MSSYKQLFTVATCGLVVSLNAFSGEMLDVNNIKFEDNNFKNCVLAQKIMNPKNITKLVCRQVNIDHANEVSYFPALKELWLSGSQLTNIDLSKNTELTSVSITKSNLANLNLNNNPKLTELNVSFNHISKLDLTKNPQLTDLSIVSNKIEDINLSENTKLMYLWAKENN